MPRIVLQLVLLAVLSAGGGVEAGTPGQDTTQRPRFEATVARVSVDVIVRDDNGFVENLTAADFRVFEDGRRVRVLGVELVDLIRGSRTTIARSDTAGAAPSGSDRRDVLHADAAEPGSEDTAGHVPGAMVFLIDTPSLTQETKLRFADAWMRILDSTETPGVPRAAYYVDHAGRVVEIAALSTDPEQLLLAVAAVEALPLTSSRRAEQLIELASDLPAPDGEEPGFVGAFGQPIDLDVATRAAVAKMRIFENEERRRAELSFDALEAFCDALWAVEGRTSLVWVSSGVRLMRAGPSVALMAAFEDAGQAALKAPVAEVVPGIRSMRAGLTDPDARLVRRQERLFEAANSAGVSIYGIDPSLLIHARMPGADASMGSGGFRRGLSDPLVIGSLDALGDSLRMAAEATGGRAFVHATDLGAALREVDADASRYYLITYAPPRAQPDGAAHQIRVEVERPGVSARWRRGYVHLTEAERRQRTAQAARLAPGLVEGASKMARARRAEEEAASVAATTAEAIEAGEVAGIPERARAAEGVPPLRPTEAMPPVAQPRAVGEADARPPGDPRVLSRTLDHLAQTALFYRASALSFSCDETIIASTFNSGGGFRSRSAYDLRYIYTFEDPPAGSSPGTFRRLRDYRTRRDEEVAPGEAPEEVKLESLGLPVAVTRAYSWAFMFQEALQPHYRFELVDEESYLDREALVISFEPVPPVVAGFNDWFGRAWIDAETYQVLRVEALQAGDYAQLDAIDKDRVTLQVPRDGRLVVRMEAEFGAEERGVRLPSRVVLTGEDFSMRALAFGLPGNISSALPEWRLKGRAAFRVEQRYENYRFFDVEVR